ncbi:MAG: endonuclease/exonuclease/phosphatase family protein [Pirellulaceae bacterium]
MSFNILYGTANDGDNHWDNRCQLVAETIRDAAPDLLGLQEVLDFQATYLQEQLTGYEFHGAGRDDGKTKGEFAPVMFRSERFQLIESGHFWLSESPDVPGSKSWDAALPRMASWVCLKDLNHADQEILFLNTHFDHRGVLAREQAAKLIHEKLTMLAQENTAVIVCGDFNTTEDDVPYQSMVFAGKDPGTLVLIDSYREKHPTRSEKEATFNGWNGNQTGSRIDWILHSHHFQTTAAEIIQDNNDGRYPSDHYPVISTLHQRK